MIIQHSTLLGSCVSRDTITIFTETHDIFLKLVKAKGDQLIPKTNIYFTIAVDNEDIVAINFLKGETIGWVAYMGYEGNSLDKLKENFKSNPLFTPFIPTKNNFIFSIPMNFTVFSAEETAIIGEIQLYIWEAIHSLKHG